MTDASRPTGGPRPPRGSSYQRWWLCAYWVAAGCNALYLVLALAASDVPPAAYFSVTTGAAATALGATMATHLARRRVGDRDFDDATGTMRVVAVAWFLLSVSIVIIMVTATDWGSRPTAGPEAIAGAVAISEGVAGQLFGAAALFVVVGDGFTKYRRLLASSPRIGRARQAPAAAGQPARLPWPTAPDGTPFPRGADGQPVFPRRSP